MAGNKINKSKGKEDKSKGNKSKGQNNVVTSPPDHALLRKPVLTSVTGFNQARKIYDWATEELKHLLSHECDVLYECKVCRNIFRSLANFISHKRVYCKEQFNPREHGHFMKASASINELLKIKRLEEEYQESLKENKEENAGIYEDDERIPFTKDLTEIVEKIARKKGLQNGHSNHSEAKIILQEIPNSSVAVFQHFNPTEEHGEGIQRQVNELNNMTSRSLAVLQPDGNCKMKVLPQDADSVIQISDDDEQNEDSNNLLKCRTCDLRFSTQKTLRFHMKYKHVESRLVYPCPDCLEIFSTSWSVYRHLFRVHRKTAAQIRRLRESIQSKAFRMNNIPAFYEKRRNNAKQAVTTRKITEEERLEQENQEWMDNMEGDGSGPRCGGCGRSFERRAALVAHTHTCVPRNKARALASAASAAAVAAATSSATAPASTSATAARRPDAKRIQIQIRRDYHKGPPADHADQNGTCLLAQVPPTIRNFSAISTSSLSSADSNVSEVQSVSKLDKSDDNASHAVDDDADDLVVLGELEEGSVDGAMSTDVPEVKAPESPESTPTDMLTDDVSPAETQVLWYDPEEQDSQPEAFSDVSSSQDQPTRPIRLPYARNAEESNLSALKNKIEQDVELEALLCKKCQNRSGTAQELFEHMATHYKWMRYACKLCNFKHYAFEKLPEHIKVVHKLKGDNDFYFSTVKALDGPEALELAENADEQNSANGNSPDSLRASRGSSESSRLSDDGSSSSIRMETGAKKRKMRQNKVPSKRKKESPCKITEESTNDSQGSLSEKQPTIIQVDAASNLRGIEENSSDIDEVDDKVAKRQVAEDPPSVASRRPVRRKTKPKNEDFEYDLSNLLKMEAQGYRDSQMNTTAKSNNTKKKSLQEQQINYENMNKDCCGAMVALSKDAVERSAAHMKMTTFSVCTAVKEQRNSNLFARPMLPKTFNKGDKSSPKKDSLEDKKDNSPSPNKEINNQKVSEDVCKRSNNEVDHADKDSAESSSLSSNKNPNNETKCFEPIKTSLNKSTIVPLKLRGQSVEILKNPLINKHIKNLTTTNAGKVLVIKPFKPGGPKGLNTPIQYQTITVKDSNRDVSGENKSSYQTRIVEVPVVSSAIARTSVDTSIVNKTPPVTSDATTETATKSADNSCENVKNTNSSSDVVDKESNSTSSAPVSNSNFQKQICEVNTKSHCI